MMRNKTGGMVKGINWRRASGMHCYRANVLPFGNVCGCFSDMEQVRGDFCYILLITRIFNKKDVKEAHRRVGVTFIKAGYASYSEAVVRVIGFPPMR